MSHVALERMTKRYGDTTAVAAIDLDVQRGEFLVLLGPSGCGKTTTLRCIAGLEAISDGRITIDGQTVSSPDVTIAPEKRGIGMVFQSYAVWPHMSVFDNVAFGLRLRDLVKSALATKVAEALDLVGLAPFAHREIHQLSGGQQQRVALARAAALEPKVLLFDEPLSNLDAQLRERMRFELRQLQRRLGITAIYVTHDQQEAMVVADRIVLMNRGRIEQVGTPSQIYRVPASPFAARFIGLSNILPATVIAAEPGLTRVRTASGLELASAQTGFAPGDAVQAVIRPEDVRVSLDPKPGALAGTVRENTYLGNMSDLVLQLGAPPTDLRVQASPAVDIVPGTPVRIIVSPTQTRLLKEPPCE